MSTVTIDGLSINYIHNGVDTSDDAKKILFVHGTGCNGRVFENLIAAMKDYEAVAIDLPGHGLSQGVGFRGVVDHAYFVAQLIDTLGWNQCVVAGHSLGGGIAIALASYFPEILRGLILIDTGARLRVAPAVIANAKKLAAGESSAKRDLRLGFSDKTHDDVITALHRLTGNEDPAVTLKDWYADDSCDFLTRLNTLDVPALAICGREDRLTPLKYHEYLRDNMPQCQLAVIDDAAHWPFLENSEEFTQQMYDFLRNL